MAPTLNAVPVTLIDIRLAPGAVFAAHWTAPMGDGDSVLRLRSGADGARLLLYAGQPQNIAVVAKGPFIAGSTEELAGYYCAYRKGKFPHAGTMRPIAPTA